ncbi:MAG: hypothetical protein CL807_08765 [Citromicrobium sp.]|jgi:hypothetical protein|nr:hypothetical protein [Citromicrobium sp.]MBD76961.1 hypothetical protein [Citromicrobium sp.]MBT47694.1 hypothetical protein [Citromicrobium sp.]|tara:strand:- start:549 stop:728 length:180 start_codon:yes stop_codon:yes gene_type:complete
MVMEGAAKKGFPVIGFVFLVLGLVKFVQGDDWVVWFILGIVFGGLGIFGRGKQSEGAGE